MGTLCSKQESPSDEIEIIEDFPKQLNDSFQDGNSEHEYDEIGEYQNDLPEIDENNVGANSFGYYENVQAQVPVEILKSSSESHVEFDVLQEADVRISGLAILRDGRVIMCNSKSKKLLVYDNKGKYLGQVGLVAFPTDIAVFCKNKSEKEAVVSFEGEKQIQFISIYPSLISPGEVMTVLYKCSGGIATIGNKIAVGRSRGVDLYNLERKMIASYDSSLEYISILKHYRKTLVLSDRYKCTKYMLDKNSEKNIFKIKTGRCLGIAVHKLGHIYFTNFDKDHMAVRGKGDPRIKIMLRSTDGIYGPRALCFSSDCSHLYIANNNGQSICILKMSA